jgi:hypothetical protein
MYIYVYIYMYRICKNIGFGEAHRNAMCVHSDDGLDRREQRKKEDGGE